MQGKKINELDLTTTPTDSTVLPVVVVNGTTPASTATKVTLTQLANYIGNPNLLFYSGLTGTTWTVANADKIVMLWKNGVLQQNTVDYTLSSTTVTFTTALIATDTIAILYNFNTPLTLPIASTTTLGAVKVDGTTVTIANGVISSTDTTYTAGTGIDIANSTISATAIHDIIPNTIATTPTVVPTAGKVYTFTQELTSLTLANYTQSYDETVIYFKSGATPTTISALPTGLSWIGGAPTIEANKDYVISICNGLVVIGHN